MKGITLSKKQEEIVLQMQKGYALEFARGVRDNWYWFRNRDSGQTVSVSRVSPATIKTLEDKGMIEIDQNHKDWKSTAWKLTERGKNYKERL